MHGQKNHQIKHIVCVCAFFSKSETKLYVRLLFLANKEIHNLRTVRLRMNR